MPPGGAVGDEQRSDAVQGVIAAQCSPDDAGRSMQTSRQQHSALVRRHLCAQSAPTNTSFGWSTVLRDAATCPSRMTALDCCDQIITVMPLKLGRMLR